MHLNNAYPSQQQFEEYMCRLNENWAVSWNAAGIPTAYLEYCGRFYPLGNPASIVQFSLEVVGEAIAAIKRHPECGYDTLPTGNTEHMEIVTPGYHAWPTSPESPAWLRELQLPAPRPRQRPTVPLARLRLSTAQLQQMLQLSADYTIKQVAIEEDGLSVYCVTPECLKMDASSLSTNPVLHADYRVEERDGVAWRSLVSVRVESPTFP